MFLSGRESSDAMSLDLRETNRLVDLLQLGEHLFAAIASCRTVDLQIINLREYFMIYFFRKVEFDLEENIDKCLLFKRKM